MGYVSSLEGIYLDKNVDVQYLKTWIFPTKSPGVHFKSNHIGVETRSILFNIFNYQKGDLDSQGIILEASSMIQTEKKYSHTLPETNIFAPENAWLGDEPSFLVL